MLSTAVLLPLVLVYLLFGLSDVLPVLMGTLMLVVNFDLRSSRLQALGMILGNFAGGLFGLLLYAALLTTPSLPFLALLLFPALLLLGQRIVAGGPAAPALLVACNAMLIIFSRRSHRGRPRYHCGSRACSSSHSLARSQWE